MLLLLTRQGMWLFGDFNNWNQYEMAFQRMEFGRWEIRIPADHEGKCRVKHLSKIKITVKGPDGSTFCRLDPWAR